MAFSLVLSGGGLKGLTHIGVLRALEERGLTPSLVVGVSMGALIGSAWAAGRRVRELEDRALSLERSDVFRIAHVDMALRRMLAPAVYRREPLERIITDLVGDRTFRDLEHRMLVNTVDINSGHPMLWGLPGLDDARVADAVFASCALPGILPPLEVKGTLLRRRGDHRQSPRARRPPPWERGRWWQSTSGRVVSNVRGSSAPDSR
jgi:NTE family protein